MTTQTTDEKNDLLNFSERLAKKWKNYFSLEGLIPGIDPTNEQKHVVQSSEKQLMIRGSAGSGKSLMLVYRLIKLMEQNEKPQRILYVTFNQTLIQDTRKRLNQSTKYKELKNKHYVNVTTYHDLVRDILMKECGYNGINRIAITRSDIDKHESIAVARIESILGRLENNDEFNKQEKLFKTHTAKFLQEEFFWMKANGLITLDQYMAKERTGRGHSPQVRMKQRPTIFYLFEQYNEFMRTNFPHHELDMEDYALHLLNELNMNKNAVFKYDHILVDEFQDLQPMQIKSLVHLTKNTITLVGDEKQRIYKRSPLSYKELNLKVNARTNQRLSRNFRSTKQIMNLASAIDFDDVDNVKEDDQVFTREGPVPTIRYYDKFKLQIQSIVKEIKSIKRDYPGKSIAVIHRYDLNELNSEWNIKRALEREFNIIGIEKYGKKFDYDKQYKPVFFTNPYEIKGLEFDYIFIIQFDRMHYPLQKRINDLNLKYKGAKLGDENYEKDYDSILNDEKKLLYVACSRAKEGLYIYYQTEKQIQISPFIREFDTRDYDSNFKKLQYKSK